MDYLDQNLLLNGLQEQPHLISLFKSLLSLSSGRAMLWLSACKFKRLPPSIEWNLSLLGIIMAFLSST